MKSFSKVLLGLFSLSFLFSTGLSFAKPWQDLNQYTRLLRWVEKGILDLNEVKPLSGDMEGGVLDPRDPDIAFDTANNRYLMVWEEEISPGNFQILGRLRNPDGSPIGTSDIRISVDRPSHGCFYDTFDADNGEITTPTSCVNRNPSVAYNSGQYLIAWEVQGAAAAPATAPDNEFSNIFVSIVDANSLTLNPLPNFAEGLLLVLSRLLPIPLSPAVGKMPAMTPRSWLGARRTILMRRLV